jgi:hypothetical protein
MISRKSTMAIAEAYTTKFRTLPSRGFSRSGPIVAREDLYKFLFENDYEPQFCNIFKNIYDLKRLNDLILGLHTGESLVEFTPSWLQNERQKLGQTCLKNMARDFMRWFLKEAPAHLIPLRETSSQFTPQDRTILTGFNTSYIVLGSAESCKSVYDAMVRQLEIDGYVFRDNELYQSEAEVLDVEEEKGLLQKLYAGLGLSKQQINFQFLNLAEEYYVAGRWSDCIGNARKFFEVVLQQVAIKHSTLKNITLPATTIKSARLVREYLEEEKLIEKKEKEAIDKIYGLLSDTGSHPYMAEKDQARLLRQICLVVTQFVMLRLEGYLKKL